MSKMSKNNELDRANHFIAENKMSVAMTYRAHYHLMAPIGWINDPNGFIFYKNEYHLFYQFYPYASQWGPMHWGHAKSKDLMHWIDLPVALAPDQAYDKEGCFSGTAIEKNGRLYLMYTGVSSKNGRTYQQQCMAVSEDGINFTKLSQNPVIAESDLADKGSIQDFRDPKLFEHEDNYYAALVTKDATDCGKVLLFRSEDLIDWSFYSVMLQGNKDQGVMWECPDFFQLDGKDVLIVSPVNIPKRGHEFDNTSSSLAFIGTMDWQKGHFQAENDHEIDGGLDFYAPQTVQDSSGRRILMAWMQMWGRTMPTHDLGHKWAGSMTLPRELTIIDRFLAQKPLSFVYENLRIDRQDQNLIITEDESLLMENFSDVSYLQFIVDFSEAESLTIRLAINGTSSLYVKYQKEEKVLTLDRNKFGYPITGLEKKPLSQRSIVTPLKDDRLKLEIFRDTNSVEVFANDRQTLTTTFYETEKGHGVSLQAVGKAKLDSVKIGRIVLSKRAT